MLFRKARNGCNERACREGELDEVGGGRGGVHEGGGGGEDGGEDGFWWGRRKEVVVKGYGVGVSGKGVEEKIWCQVGGGGL